MNNEELKNRVGSGIARLRRERGLTQAELAERINYSDKAVSKWERGESLPDVLTLMNLAQILETDLNTLTGCGAQEALPEVPEEPEITEKLPPKRRRADRSAVQKLSSILVWVVALFLFLVFDSFQLPYCWMIFVVAVMANAIVLLSLRSVWQLYGINRLLVSIILWTALLFLYLLLLFTTGVHVWRIFLMGIVGQIAILLWFKIFPYPQNKQEESHE